MSKYKTIDFQDKMQRIRFYKLYQLVSYDGFNISSINEDVLYVLVTKNIVQSPTDIFKLVYSKELHSLFPSEAKNIIEDIKRHQSIELASLIYAFGIEGLSRNMAGCIAYKFSSVQSLLDKAANQDNFLMQLSDIGLEKTVAFMVWQFFSSEKHKEKIINLLSLITII